MSKFSRFFLTAMAISLFGFFTACDNGDEVTPGTDPTDTTDNNPPPDENGFSSLSPAENKANLEQTGIDLVTNMTALKDSEGAEVAGALISFLTGGDVEVEARKSTGSTFRVLGSLARFRSGSASATDVLKGMRKREEIPTEEEVISLQEEFDAAAGVYAYNVETAEFDTVSLGGNAIIFKFPSTENGTTNNAQLTIDGLTVTSISNTEVDRVEELPTALQAEIEVDGSVVVSYSWSADYKANGEPENLETALTVGEFKFAVEVVNTTTDISVDYALTRGTTNIIALGVGAEGNFNSDLIGDEGVDADDVVDAADAYVQLFNIKVAGDVDVNALVPALDAADALNDDTDSSVDDIAVAKAWDDHSDIVVTYADSGDKIAETEFYYYSESEDVSIRLIFADETKQDIEVYSETGFTEFEDQLETLLDELGWFGEDSDEAPTM